MILMIQEKGFLQLKSVPHICNRASLPCWIWPFMKVTGLDLKLCQVITKCDCPFSMFIIYLRCFVDCGAIVSPSNKFRVTSECSNSACVGASYEWILERFDTESWETVSNVAYITATPINSSNIIIEQNMLLSNTQYRLKLSVISLMKVEGYGLLEFETAGEPHGGFCKSLVTEGVSLETGFIFECIDWTDESTPLTYEFRNGDDPISYGISPVSPKTVLRAGDPENNYEITINVFIKNAVGVKVVYSFDIKVR